MYNELSEHRINCPYCGEYNTVFVELQCGPSEYIEDCQVCCRPMVFHVIEEVDGTMSLHVNSENETF